MAETEDRTEAATPRRLQTAREGGQVALSREAPPLAVLASAALVLTVLAPFMATDAVRRLAPLLERLDRVGPGEAIATATFVAVELAAPFALVGLLAGSVAVLAQTGGLVHLGALLPDFSRLDPRRGIGRIAGPRTLLETGKAILKIAFTGWAGWHVGAAALPSLPGLVGAGPVALVAVLRDRLVALLMMMLAVQAGVAGLDVLRVHLRHARDLRMSRQEIRDEQKESEGDPRLKARRRAVQRQRAKRRMLASVPSATVVVTNPTHYAVALAYARGSRAPRVVAKGIDALAARIREVATANGVPLIADPPLARALHTVEIDTEIPAEHYKAVAEIIAYVWRLAGPRDGRAG